MGEREKLIKIVALRYLVALMVTGLVLFISAGTFAYGQAWIYLAMLYGPMIGIIWYLFVRDFELLKRRLQTKEREPGQSTLSNLFYISIGLVLVIAGLDKRLGWSSVPSLIMIVSSIFFLVGYFFLFLVFKKNKYLAHTVVVEDKQTVVLSGPYAVVRHPMYASELMMSFFTALLLGSYWAILPNVLLMVLLVARIITEERFLLEKLSGYHEYTLKVKYRLIPGIW